MKKKLLLFALAALAVTGFTSQAFAQVTTGDTSNDPVFTIGIPSAAAWSIDDTTTCTLSSDDFNFSGLNVAVPNSQSACEMNLGDGTAEPPDSFLVTNDPTVVGDNAVTLEGLTCDVGGNAGSVCDFTADRVFTVTSTVAPKADFNILVYKKSASAGVGDPAENPEIGTVDLVKVGDNLAKADAVAMTMVGTTNKYGLDIKFDLDESTLGEFDAPQTVVVTYRLTIAGPTY